MLRRLTPEVPPFKFRIVTAWHPQPVLKLSFVGDEEQPDMKANQ